MSSAPTLGLPGEEHSGALAPTRPKTRRTPVRGWSLGRPARVARGVLWPTLLEPVVRAFYGLRVNGAERLADVPGPVIFAANHCAHLDNAFIIMALPKRWRRRLAIAAATNDIFRPRHFGLPMKGWIAQLLGNAFPFTERGGRVPARIDHLQGLLEQGWSVLLFPEGKLTVGGPMQRFRPGIGLIATESGVPVVPLRLDVVRPGPWEGGGRLSRGEVVVNIGEPMRFEPGEELARARARLEAAVRAL